MTYHRDTGFVPPFTGVAVNVTWVPAHTVVTGVLILILTGRFGLTVMQIELEVAGFPLAQTRFEVRMQVMQSPLTGV